MNKSKEEWDIDRVFEEYCIYWLDNPDTGERDQHPDPDFPNDFEAWFRERVELILKDQRERIAEKIDKERKPHPNKLEFKEGITRTVFRKRKNRTIAYNHGLDTALRIIQEEE